MAGNALTLSCVPSHGAVFVGESLRVQTALTNSSSAAVDVVSPRSPAPPPLVFELRSPTSGKVIHRVDVGWVPEDPDGGRLEPELPLMEPLLPGQAQQFDHDLCELTPSVFASGGYHLVARYTPGAGPEVLSPAVDLRVSAPMIHHVASLACPNQWLVCTAFDHLGGDGVQVLAREPLSDEASDGVFYRWADLDGIRQLDSLALAAHTAPRGEGRWLAWIQAGRAAAVRPWGNVLSARVQPLDLDLERALLAEPGFQLADGTGLFVAAGEAPGGAHVTWLHLSARGGQRGSVVPLAPDLPSRVLARYDPGPTKGRLHLVWADPAAAGARILRRTFRGDGQPEDADPELLLERPAPLRALELHPLGDGDRALVHALVGPDDEQMMSYFRLPLVGPDWQMEEWTFPAFDDPVDDWAIAASSAKDLPVLARCGDRFLLTRAKAEPHWHPLADGAMGTTHLHLLATGDGRLWAGWCEPHIGPVYMGIH